MSRIGLGILDTNDLFPNLELQLVSRESLAIPKGLGDDYSVILFYRGYW